MATLFVSLLAAGLLVTSVLVAAGLVGLPDDGVATLVAELRSFAKRRAKLGRRLQRRRLDHWRAAAELAALEQEAGRLRSALVDYLGSPADASRA